MSEEWLLTVADVAEALGCTLDHVEALIANSQLAATSASVRRITHTELRRFVTSMQSTALALGVSPLPVSSLLASQPIGVRDEHESAR